MNYPDMRDVKDLGPLPNESYQNGNLTKSNETGLNSSPFSPLPYSNASKNVCEPFLVHDDSHG